MKQGLHPKYETTTYVCSCGNTFEGQSTRGGTLHIELCNKCHPFFTGQQKFVDTGGRVQRFANKFGAAAAATLEKEKATVEARHAAAEKAEAKKRAEREAKVAAKAARAEEFAHHAPEPEPESEPEPELEPEPAVAENAAAAAGAETSAETSVEAESPTAEGPSADEAPVG
ncbi:MAG: 50S ribosomal protein L31 [Actinomycetes bacterium]|jgi:large subunit ribosomal protein L31|nr:50S ribosomal protein L31 [Actinomycetes bacterium]